MIVMIIVLIIFAAMLGISHYKFSIKALEMTQDPFEGVPAFDDNFQVAEWAAYENDYREEAELD